MEKGTVVRVFSADGLRVIGIGTVVQVARGLVRVHGLAGFVPMDRVSPLKGRLN